MKEETKIITLKYPIKIPAKDDEEAKEIKVLTFGRIKAKHLRSLPDSFMNGEGKISAADMIPIIASLADIKENEADELDVSDLMEVAEVLQSFLEKSHQTGKK